MDNPKFPSIVLILIIWLLSGLVLQAQKQSDVEVLSRELHQALIDRNENQLELLLHTDLSYGHSNGWVENKEDLIRNNQTNYLIYKKISMDSLSVKYTGKISTLRFQSLVDVILNGKNISLKLYVCQVWIKSKGKWKLLTRQSAKLI